MPPSQRPTKATPSEPAPASNCRGSDTLTRGIRVTVTPSFVPEQSGAGEAWKGQRYVFAYHIRVTNEGEVTAQLISRHWTIVDADGEQHEVRGEGVVGKQPTLAPGEAFEYSSYCPLPTPWGTMEGEYLMETDRGERFEAAVSRFYLVSS
jgi:ApaG protein